MNKTMFSIHKVKTLWIVLLMLSVPGNSGYRSIAAQQNTQVDFSELEQTALAELKETNTPGATVGVISGDKLIFAKAFGVSSTESNDPMTVDMLFRLGSTTKMFTATALVTLAEQGKIKLESPIGNYVKGLNQKIAAVTAHQLLSHTAGIIDDAPMYGRHDDAALAEEVRLWKEDKLFTEPGRIISYSNPGYWLAGFVVQEVAGKPYADQLNDAIFAPLGMKRTTFRPTVAMTYPLAQGHNAVRTGTPAIIRPFADNSASWPAGSIFSNVPDLARFVIALMNGGMNDGNQVLPSSLLNKLSAPHAAIPGNDEMRYGYGLMSGMHRGVKVVQHGGSRSGYGSIIRMAPDKHFAVIVLANRTGSALNKTAEKAMELMLPLTPVQKEDEKPLAMSATEIESYAGIYSQGENKIEIAVREGKLFLKQETQEGPVTKKRANLFSAAMPNGGFEFTFVLGAGGRVEFLHAGLRSFKKRANTKPAP